MMTDEEWVEAVNDLKKEGLTNPEIVATLGIGTTKLQGLKCLLRKAGHKFHEMKIQSKEEFVRKAFEAHGFVYCYEKTVYKGTGTKVIVTCHVHGDFLITPNAHLYRKRVRGTPNAGHCPHPECRYLSREEREAFQQGYFICRDCKEKKEATAEFFPIRPSGNFRRQCTSCLAKTEAERRARLGDEYLESERKRWPKRNAIQNIKARDRYFKRKENEDWHEEEKARNRARAKRDSHKWRAQRGKRRAQKLRATPKWLAERHWELINKVYDEARELSDHTGEPHHVDHIMPLISRHLCGLHVPWNLQILTEEANKSKGNRLM